MSEAKVQGRRVVGLSIVGWLLLGLALSGCADLSAIRKFSAISTEAETYERITKDLANIPERKKYYESQKFHAGLEKQRKSLEEAMPGILALHEGVAEYMKALGELADNKVISHKEKLNLLADEVKKLAKSGAIKEIKEPTVDAFTGLADLLSKAATDAYRRRKLQLFIGNANPHLQSIITTQKNIIGKDYVRELNDEYERMDTYYGDVILEAVPRETKGAPPEKELEWKAAVKSRDYGKIITQANLAPEQKVSLMQLRDELQQRKDVIDTKKKEAANYVKVLTKIQEGHQALYDSRNAITSASVQQVINEYSADIKKTYEALTALK